MEEGRYGWKKVDMDERRKIWMKRGRLKEGDIRVCRT